jgi:NADPH-dependent curcumin reductase CurA
VTDSLPDAYKQIVLKRRPAGLVTPEDFEVVEVPMPELADGEALVRPVYLGMDATVRTWLNRGEGYLPAVEIGEVVRCGGVGTVVASKAEHWSVGDSCLCLPGWSEYLVTQEGPFTSPTPMPEGADMLSALSVFGATGVAAYMGLLEIGRPQAGETVVVSAAAGATGSVAGQIAKIMGCRVIGIAGSDEKCAWVVDDLGFDGCINHRTEDVPARLKELCPERIDVYFDNVGGPILDAVLKGLNLRGRVVLCGSISAYNEVGRPPGPANYVELIAKRGRMEGFIAYDYWDRFGECIAQLSTWASEGKLRWRQTIVEGLENAPHALNMLFTGENIGKVVVQVNPSDP